jgi:hypothetical protein
MHRDDRASSRTVTVPRWSLAKLFASTIPLVSRKARASQRPKKLKPPAEHLRRPEPRQLPELSGPSDGLEPRERRRNPAVNDGDCENDVEERRPHQPKPPITSLLRHYGKP